MPASTLAEAWQLRSGELGDLLGQKVDQCTLFVILQPITITGSGRQTFNLISQLAYDLSDSCHARVSQKEAPDTRITAIVTHQPVDDENVVKVRQPTIETAIWRSWMHIEMQWRIPMGHAGIACPFHLEQSRAWNISTSDVSKQNMHRVFVLT